MAKRKQATSVETITHDAASRRNIPKAEYTEFYRHGATSGMVFAER